MMKASYKKMFQLKALHSYFDQSICKCLTFRPSQASIELIRRFGLVVETQIDGFNFYGNTKSNWSDYLAYIESVSGESSFDFEINTNISNFNLITDLPTDWTGSIAFETDNKSNIFNNNILSIKGDYASKNELNTLALIKIKFKDILQYKQDNSHTQFEIKFDTRSTQWQYYIINKSAIELDHPKISSKSDISFTEAVKTTIATGQEALLFTSGDQLLPLSETAKYKFNLVNEAMVPENTIKSQTSYKVIFNGLPNPNPESNGFTVDSETKIIASPIYVYI